ncbi:Carbohydrate esterase family 4 [Mycena sanguinolenta]|uniref:Carbohydrate esterase family 4 n=1 Tax=Mycena sanguinolenta TaxID=230812 RepID=A0A8H6XIH9_9AGAR|nr:Carbohydrate esterase family 4 [Mycena sanguinolenta]
MLPHALLLLVAPLLVFAGDDGGITGATSSAEAAGYSCDATKCKLPTCNCASPNPPGGLSPSDVPMFVVFTADDAVQSYTLDSVNQFLGHRQNPNGCQPKMTYFTSLSYTNYTLVTDWYVAGNEIADHTMTHVGDPPKDEINGNLIALNALAGIPYSSIQGFRAPFLNYSVNTLKLLYAANFTYDSSSAASIPVTDPGTDAFWPYTLDNASRFDLENMHCVNDGIIREWRTTVWRWRAAARGSPFSLASGRFQCTRSSTVRVPRGRISWTHGCTDVAAGNNAINDSATLEYMKNTFTAHYNGNRQPIGLYTHPIHLSTTYPGVNPSNSTINMINEFLDWAQEQQNVWIVSNEQLLAWVKNPVTVANLGSVDALKCSTPQVDASQKICNGIPGNEAGLLSHCAFSDFPFYTCYGCPETEPTTATPNPPQQVPDGQQARFRLPANCSTAFWDPIAGNCLCSSSQCAFTDTSRPIGPNGANLTGGGTGGSAAASASITAAYVPFNGRGFSISVSGGVWAALGVGLLGAVVGAVGVF